MTHAYWAHIQCKENSIEKFLNLYSKAFEIIAKYVLKAHVHFFMHAGMQARKTKEKTVRSEHLEYSYYGRTVQNSLWILFFKCCIFLN